MSSTQRNENGFRPNDILRRNFTVEGPMKVLARMMQHMKSVSNHGDTQADIIQCEWIVDCNNLVTHNKPKWTDGT